jgi:uncharacterized membrane protein
MNIINKTTNENTLYLISKILAVIGICLAVYLYVNYIYKPAFQPCSISAQVNCDAVTKGEISTFVGLPVPLVGLVGYLVILAAAMYKKPKVMFGMALFGTLFCLRLTIIEIFELNVICPVCLACQIDMIVSTYFAYVLMKRTVAEPVS